jgi:hypothetical protein
LGAAGGHDKKEGIPFGTPACFKYTGCVSIAAAFRSWAAQSDTVSPHRVWTCDPEQPITRTSRFSRMLRLDVRPLLSQCFELVSPPEGNFDFVAVHVHRTAATPNVHEVDEKPS